MFPPISYNEIFGDAGAAEACRELSDKVDLLLCKLDSFQTKQEWIAKKFYRSVYRFYIVYASFYAFLQQIINYKVK